MKWRLIYTSSSCCCCFESCCCSNCSESLSFVLLSLLWFESISLKTQKIKNCGIPHIHICEFRLVIIMVSIKVERCGVIHTYTLLEKLGTGSYSQVYKCQREVEGHTEIFVILLLYTHNFRLSKCLTNHSSEMRRLGNA